MAEQNTPTAPYYLVGIDPKTGLPTAAYQYDPDNSRGRGHAANHAAAMIRTGLIIMTMTVEGYRALIEGQRNG